MARAAHAMAVNCSVGTPWKVTGRAKALGKGNFASVYAACRRDEYECPYVMRIGQLQGQYTDYIPIHHELARLGYTVPLEDSWICTHTGKTPPTVVTITRRLKMTMREWKKLHDDHLTYDEWIDLVLFVIQDFFLALIKDGYLHQDLHPSNIMVEEVESPGRFTFTFKGIHYRMYMIDIGSVVPYNPQQEKISYWTNYLSNSWAPDQAFEDAVEKFIPEEEDVYRYLYIMLVCLKEVSLATGASMAFILETVKSS